MRLGRLVAVVVTGTLALAGAGWSALWLSASLDTWGEIAFDALLTVPPVAASHVDATGRRVVDLRLQAGRHDFGAGVEAETWGVDGTYLGPTVRVQRGEDLRVNVANDLDEPTTLHWHGMDLPGEMDGGPHQQIEPGRTWSPQWRVDQPPATLWYHPHLHGRTAEHVHRGLAGLLLVDDPDGAPPGLPSTYGVDDVPVIIQDRTFVGGRMVSGATSVLSPTGPLGRTVVVNGTIGPYLDVTTQTVRLRLLNASLARVYAIGMADGRAFDLVGVDGGLLTESRPVTSVQLSPGDRAEVVVTMVPGERVVLRSAPPRLGAGAITNRFAGGDDRLDILELRAAARLMPSPPLPATLAPADPPATDGPVTRQFTLAGDKVNGRAMDMGRIDAVVLRDRDEVWEVTNTDATPHNVHIHGVQFRVVATTSRRGVEPVPAELTGWQDTVFVPPGHSHRIALRFARLAASEAPYMLHCHLLRHEDNGMMAQIAVVEHESDVEHEPVPHSGHGHH